MCVCVYICRLHIQPVCCLTSPPINISFKSTDSIENKNKNKNMADEAHSNPRDSPTIHHSRSDSVENRHSTASNGFLGDTGKIFVRFSQLCSSSTDVGSSSPRIKNLPVKAGASSTRRAPDDQTPAPDPSSPTTEAARDGKITRPRPWILSWIRRRVRRILDWIRTPTGWTLGLTFFSVVFAISFGVFSIMSWNVAVKANQKADLAILIAQYQYKLDEYNKNLTIFGTKLAIQTRDDGRLASRLQYYALCMSNSVGCGHVSPFTRISSLITDDETPIELPV